MKRFGLIVLSALVAFGTERVAAQQTALPQAVPDEVTLLNQEAAKEAAGDASCQVEAISYLELRSTHFRVINSWLRQGASRKATAGIVRGAGAFSSERGRTPESAR